MNLLLLLSAMLSALAGVGAGARPAQAAVACARAADGAVAARAVAPAAAVRPVVGLPRLAALPSMSGATWRVAAAVPLFLSRRRE